jgi:hypothetical protein
MPSKVLLVRIFIARPSDAEKEALLVKDACKQISKFFLDSKGVTVDANDFKDLFPTGGNPQRTIDQGLLNTCDILVYVMNKSVGRGGFKSEIQKGLKRFKDESIPFIFYMKVPLSKREARSRTKFLARIKSKFSFSEFISDSELTGKIQAQLTAEIMKIYEASTEKSLAVIETDKQVSNSMPEKTKAITKTVQAKALIKRADTNDLSTVINKALGNLSTIDTLNEYEKSRLYLYAASLIFGKELGSETLGNHEINLLYKYKEKVKPAGDEVNLIFRSLISDIYHHRAGWYWLQKIKKFKILLYYSLSLFTEDSSDEVKIGALNLMDRFWDKRFLNVIKKHLGDFSESVQEKAIDVLTNHPTKQSLEIVEVLSKSSESHGEKLKKAKMSILLIIDVHELIEQVINDSEIKSYDLNDQIYVKAYEEELQRLLRHKEEGIRIEAFTQLIKRGIFTNDQLAEYLHDKDWVIRYLAIQELVNKNIINTPSVVSELLKEGYNPFFGALDYREDELMKTIYKRLQDDKLIQHIEWGSDGSVAYGVYSLRKWDEIKSSLRGDLKDEYKTKRKEILTSMAARENCTIVSLEATFAKYDDFITGTFIETALEILLEKGDLSDKHFAYQFIEKDSYSISKVCQKLIVKYGTEEDAQFLFDYSIKNNRIDTKLLSRAFELDKTNKQNLIDKGLNSSIKNLPTLTLSYCYNHKIVLSSDQEAKVLEMLKHKDYSIRELACAYIINLYSPKKLKQLLVTYQSIYPYFYNVVAYLDIILYAHPKLKKDIKIELTEKLLKKI